MNCLIACLILWTVCFSAESLDFTSHSDAKLDSLRITFSVNKTDKWGYAKMPVTRKEAESAGFIQIGKSCSGLFQGYRYMKDNDTAVILLYDDQGSIAGVQTSYSENEIKSPKAKAWFKQGPMFTVEHLPVNKSDTFYTLTSYLVNPDTICAGSRLHLLGNSAVETNFYFKNGTRNVLIPKQESKIKKNKEFVKGKCVAGMGYHYWYGVSENMNCNYFPPFYPLYLNGKLIAYGFVVFDYFHSPRYGPYEHPTPDLYGTFIEVVPKCLYQWGAEIGNVTTFHIYMIDDPANIKC